MAPRNVILWMLLPIIVVLVMTTCVQAQELTEVPASKILEQIENGENIFLEDVRIIGELDLSKIELNTIPIARPMWVITRRGLEEELKIVESKIEIHNSAFEDDFDFSNTQFRKDIIFLGTSFLGKIDFKGADFRDDVNFCGANFGGDADFQAANFGGNGLFWNADFSGDADFQTANFGGYVNFGWASFGGDADFCGANFGGYVNFRDADFRDDVNFCRANFGGDADFGWASFGGAVNIWDADFRDDADFYGANFGGDADFGDVDFYGNATFHSTEFNKVSFSNTSFTNVSLIESDFNQMKVEWRTLKDALSADGLTYIKLIKNFREMEQFEDADAAYYKYRRLSQANKKRSFSKLTDVVAGFSCGYGVKPWNAAALAVVIILIFIPIYGLRGGIRRSKENDEKDEEDVSSRRKTWNAFVDAFYFSMVTFTTIGYGDLYPADRYRKVAVMIEGLLGWLILALFLVTLANVMIRP